MQIEVRSNIIGDIAKIRKGVVFKEYATVVDEMLQNCGRAGAQNVRVEIEEDRLVVEDDGLGCEDPQAVFEKNTTAWGNEDEAFGEGFFSVFLLADRLEVASKDWELEIDVLQMMETGNLKIDVRKSETHLPGFRVAIHGPIVEKQAWRLEHEARLLGKIAPFDAVLNGTPVQKESMFEVHEDFSMRFDNEVYEGVLAPRRGFTVIDVFYENRPVKDHYVGSVTGKLQIKKGQMTLKAPDRKEFIYDEKKKRFDEMLKADMKTLYRAFVRDATDEELDTFADVISECLDVEDYLPLLTLDASLFDFTQFGQPPEDEQEEERDENQVKMAATEFQKALESAGVVFTDAGVDVSGARKPKRVGMALVDAVAADKRLVWVNAAAVDSMKAEIRQAEYLGFRVVVAKNRLYEQAFEHLKVPHVRALEEDVETDHRIERVESRTKKEERLLALLHRVERHFDLPRGTIQLADLEMVLKFSLHGEVLEIKKKRVNGVCDKQSRKIYLSRQLIDWTDYRAQGPDYPNVTIHDYRVLLQVMNTLAHELAHLLFLTKDNTTEQDDAECQVYEEIVRLF